MISVFLLPENELCLPLYDFWSGSCYSDYEYSDIEKAR